MRRGLGNAEDRQLSAQYPDAHSSRRHLFHHLMHPFSGSRSAWLLYDVTETLLLLSLTPDIVMEKGGGGAPIPAKHWKWVRADVNFGHNRPA